MLTLTSVAKLGKPDPPAWWADLCQVAHFSEKQALLFWTALCQSAHPEIKALIVQSHLLRGHLKRSSDEELSMLYFLRQTWTPAKLIRILEELCREKLLRRQVASKMQECFLQNCDKNGIWYT